MSSVSKLVFRLSTMTDRVLISVRAYRDHKNYDSEKA